ncbi:MAG: nuclear transport factor 2 family protein [Acidimicrobiales bacterium]
MASSRSTTGGAVMLERLCRATNDRDLEALVGCFASTYRNETPAHPERGFRGREQVRRNWEQIFAAIPDLTTELLRSTVDGGEVWSEWEHRGTRADGSQHLMRGVIIFGVVDELATWARFYLEPVQKHSGGVDEFLRGQVSNGDPT